MSASRSRSRSRRLGRLAVPAGLALALVSAWALVLTPGVAAGGTSFGSPSATSQWAQGVTFREAVTLASTPRRVEIVVTSESDPSSFVAEVTAPQSSAATLSYTLAAGTTGILPNTPFTARWRVTYPDGTVDVGPPVSVTYADTRFAWRTLSGPVVRVHWYSGDAAFGRRALAIGEGAIAGAGRLLGVTETQPIDFYIYADQTSFYDALGPGTRENVGGQANPEIRTLFALITPGEINAQWVSTVIPHELTHLVFDGAVKNPYHYPPRWLNEGLAVYYSQGYGASDRAIVAASASAGSLMPLQALTGEFPTTGDRFSLAYAESVSAVDYFIRTYGQGALVKLIRSYAVGRTDDEAFGETIGRGMTAFSDDWLRSLGAAEPTAYGPQPAPAGPLPPDWSAIAGAGGSPAVGAAGTSEAATAAPVASTADGQTPGPGSAGSGDLVLVAAVAALVAAGVVILLGGRRNRRRPPVTSLDGHGDPGPGSTDDPAPGAE